MKGSDKCDDPGDHLVNDFEQLKEDIDIPVPVMYLKYEGDDPQNNANGYLIRINQKNTSMPLGINTIVLQNVGLGDWTGGGLKISNIEPGLVDEWNFYNPTTQVCEDDVIVKVNSVRDNCEEMLKEMDEPLLQMRLLRYQDFQARSEYW